MEKIISISRDKKEKKNKKTTRINTGAATNDLVLSAYNSSNDLVFPHILDLYIPPKSKIAETTYGKGVFWKAVDKKRYDITFSDLKSDGLPSFVSGGIDARKLPYKDKAFNAVVFDPPYMHTPGGTAHNGHQNYEEYYANNVAEIQQGKKYHEAVLDLYFKAAKEAWRVLEPNGIYVVKCQDEVCSNKQRLTHVEIINELVKKRFIVEDIFVVVRNGKPGVSRAKKQYHARKNHSYFLVFRKPKAKKAKTATKAKFGPTQRKKLKRA